MTRTPAKSPTNKLSSAHLDTGGTHEGFIWATALREHVAGDHIEEPKYQPLRRTTASTDRVPFEPDANFEALTTKALKMAERLPESYARLLALLEECDSSRHGPLAREQRRGASYKRLAAAAAYAAGLSYEVRQEWYRVAESIPLADRHTGHILSKLRRRAA